MDDYFRICILLAEKALKKEEVPIGAVIVQNNKIISKAFNLRETLKDITAHAEILAIKKASKKLDNWNLSDCDLYVTLKPCTMCESVIKQSRIRNVFYLCEKLSYKKEYNKTSFQYKKVDILTENYGKILSKFFANKR